MSRYLENLEALRDRVQAGEDPSATINAQLICAFQRWIPKEWSSESIFLARTVDDDEPRQGRLVPILTSIDAINDFVEDLRAPHGIYMVTYEFDDEPSDTNHYGHLYLGRKSGAYAHTIKKGEAVGCSTSYARAMCLAILDLRIAEEIGLEKKRAPSAA